MLAHKVGLLKYDKPPQVTKALSKYIKDLMNWLNHESWKKKLIMESGEKIMEDGLATKDSSYLVD